MAVLAVVAFHAFPDWLSGGFIGVDVFFVISGFLISSIIFENLDHGTFSFAEFYARRIKRIFPALLVVLLACGALGWYTLLADEYKQLGKHIAAGAGFLANFVLWQEAGYFDNSAATKPLLHLWSLGIEEQFYILWPLLLWLAWKQNFNLLSITLLIAITSFYLNVKGIQTDTVAAFYLPQMRFWELLCGTLLAWFRHFGRDLITEMKANLDRLLAAVIYREGQALDGQTLPNVLSMLGLSLLVYGFWQINKDDLSFPGHWAILPVLGAMLMIFAGPKAWANRDILSHRIVVWFGLISYPLYLWHWPLLSFARIVEGGMPNENIRVAAVILSVVLAWLTYNLIERPVRFGKSAIPKVIVLVGLMSTVGCLGYFVYSQDGFKFRHAFNISMDEKAIKKEREKYWAGRLEHQFANASTKVVIYGDSQGFDIYKSLMNDDSIGIKIFRVGTECTAFNLPKFKLINKAKECKNAFDAFLRSTEIQSADIILYSFYWIKHAEPAKAFENYKNNLAKIRNINPNAKIAFLGPKPLLGKSWIPINAIIRDQKSVLGMNNYLNRVAWIRETENAYVKNLSQALGVSFIDVNEIFCLDGCEFYRHKMFTYFDQNHWTEFGAKIFFNKLRRSRAYQDVFAN